MARLNWSDAEMYWQAITQIEAQSLLLQLRVSDYPHLKDASRKKTHREFHRLAYPKNENAETLTTAELAARIKAALNG